MASLYNLKKDKKTKVYIYACIFLIVHTLP